MSTAAKELFDRANAAGKAQVQYLQLGIKQEGGGSKSTGKHICVFISDKEGDGKDPITGAARKELQMVVSEHGVEKLWNRPIMSKDGKTLDYLVAKIAELQYGDTFSVEMKSAGMKSFIELIKLSGADAEKVENGIPTIQLDEDDNGAEDRPGLDDDKDISPEDIPF
jgi:hypothetical protein